MTRKYPGDAGSFADRHPFLAGAAIVALVAFGGLSIFVTLALKSKIDGQVEQDRVTIYRTKN
jgi:hypothetical protein